jgi:hypothetical protein
MTVMLFFVFFVCFICSAFDYVEYVVRWATSSLSLEALSIGLPLSIYFGLRMENTPYCASSFICLGKKKKKSILEFTIKRVTCSFIYYRKIFFFSLILSIDQFHSNRSTNHKSNPLNIFCMN